MVSKKDSEKSAACGGNYQDEVILQAEDDSEACQDDEDREENVIEAVFKVCSIRRFRRVANSLLSASQNCTNSSLESPEAPKLA